MIQDIAPHRLSNVFHVYKIRKGDYLLYYRKREILLKHDGEEIIFPKYEEIDPAACRHAIYLFSIDDCRFFWTDEMDESLLDTYNFESIQVLRSAHPKYMAFAGVTGMQLSSWYQNRRFCGRCGTGLEYSDKERMLYCPKCGQMEYPKISPAVIIAVTHGNKLLLSKYADREYKKYALLAGFAEIGETIEETVKREVMEEVGLKVKNLRYYKSQPWSFTDTLLFGFYAELDGDENITLDRQELAMAEWFEREELPVRYEDCSLTNEMIMAFKEGRM
ncbi:MAG: NAD(+) diphosphatase [Coprococcus sp.]